MKKPYQIPFLLLSSLVFSSCGGPGASSVSVSTSVPASSSSSSSSSSSASLYSQFSSLVNVHDLGLSSNTHYLPSTGKQKLLVIPIEIKGYESWATSALKTSIQKAFFGDKSETGWESLASFYSASSYGQLSLSGTVSDFYDCGLTTSQIQGSTTNSINDAGVTKVIDGAISWYKSSTGSDLTEFDNDEDGNIDGVWFLYACPDYSQDSSLGETFWAFTSWYGDTPSLTAPTLDTFGWASTDFIFEGYGTTAVDAHTLIHETGHMMGLEDYYDYNSVANPMGRVDMMDNNIIDHNAWSKFNYGWVSPFVVDQPGTITLRPSVTSGDCLLLPSSSGWNGTPFDEFLLLEYYTPEGVNEQDSLEGYAGRPDLYGFSEKGIRIYHVDARLAIKSTSGSSYTDKISATKTSSSYTTFAHSNTASQNLLDSSDRLIQELDCTNKRNFASGKYSADNTTLFKAGDTFTLAEYSASFPKKTTLNDGGDIPYQISIDSLTESGATLTITSL
jgi:M6 family metalloprotease-like protein